MKVEAKNKRKKSMECYHDYLIKRYKKELLIAAEAAL